MSASPRLTNTLHFPVTVSKTTANELRITGLASIEPEDYGILRPAIVDSATITKLTVTIAFDWTVEAGKKE